MNERTKDRFLVGIRCITYNQSAFITDTLDGFAMQKTTFPFVAVVIDDASTDDERKVIKNYIENHFSVSEETGYREWQTDKVAWIYAQHKDNKNCYFAVAFLKENLFRNPKKDELVKEFLQAKYIALCEGDDYWTDPLKLQKQVDFLESHESYSMCFTNCIVDNGGKRSCGNVTIWDTYTTQDILLHNSLDMVKRGDRVVSPGHTSTFVYRRPSEPLPVWISKCFIGDEPTFIAISKYGKAKFINEATSVYRQGVGTSSRDFSFERDNYNRVKMYQIIDEGLGWQYHRLISSKIIARYYKKLIRIAWGEKRYFKSAGYFAQFLRSKIA